MPFQLYSISQNRAPAAKVRLRYGVMPAATLALDVSSALDEAAKPAPPAAGAAETLPAPGSSGAAGPVVTNRADAGE